MYPKHPAITEAEASYRRRDYEHHANDYRMAKKVGRAHRQIPAIRRTLGRGAVAIGVRLLPQERAQGC